MVLTSLSIEGFAFPERDVSNFWVVAIVCILLLARLVYLFVCGAVAKDGDSAGGCLGFFWVIAEVVLVVLLAYAALSRQIGG